MSDLWSNDKGFDPIVRHIKARGYKRRRDGQARPAPAPQRPLPAHAQAVADLLKRSGKNKRPRKRATLANYLATQFQKKMTAEEIEQAVEHLLEAGLIAGTEAAVTFRLLEGIRHMMKPMPMPFDCPIESSAHLEGDRACGTDGMLRGAKETLQPLAREHRKKVAAQLYAQKINVETHAICEADQVQRVESSPGGNFADGSD